ncbi:MAG: hypothetical protein PVF85_00195 [Anaerolineales bacterium]
MKEPVVVVGIGQMGGVFARGLLRVGHPVFPVLHDMSLRSISEEIKQPALVLVAVAKQDLAGVLEEMPLRWKDRVGLLQNELLPSDWQMHGIVDPTVISVWFEKKFRRPIKPLVPSTVYGPMSGLLEATLATLDLRVQVLDDFDELVEELVMKNLFILTINIAGLEGAEAVGALLDDHLELTRSVFKDVLNLQEARSGKKFDSQAMWKRLTQICRVNPEHRSLGRSAPERLETALEQADSLGLEVAALRRIGQRDKK